MKLNFLFFILLSTLVLFLTGCVNQTEKIVIKKPEISDDSDIVSSENLVVEENMIKENEEIFSEIEVPSVLDLEVPFVSQAPLRDWSMPYQEACEEASMLSVARFFLGGRVDSQSINEDLLSLIAWEKNNDYKIDLNAEEVVEILDYYFDLEAELTDDVNIDRIKYELNLGHPIIIPTAGRLLGNPYFTGDGPIYHMLVVRGYDRDEFITNDVGTNTKGNGFKYKYSTIINSVRDWRHELAGDGMTEDEILLGEKVMVVVKAKK